MFRKNIYNKNIQFIVFYVIWLIYFYGIERYHTRVGFERYLS